jgi:anti-sigma B factor antagonist
MSGAGVTTLNTKREGSILIVNFQDVSLIDESRIESVGKELLDLTSDGVNEKIALNFQSVGFMSSAMISKVIDFGNACKREKIKLRLCCINDNVRKVFDLMRLEKVFDIDEDEETSMAKLANRGWFG